MNEEKMLQNVEILNNEVEDKEYHEEPRLIDLIDELSYSYKYIIMNNVTDCEDNEKTSYYVIKLKDKFYAFDVTEDVSEMTEYHTVGFVWYGEVEPKEVTKIEYIPVK